jgi:hypothetical protein
MQNIMKMEESAVHLISIDRERERETERDRERQRPQTRSPSKLYTNDFLI